MLEAKRERLIEVPRELAHPNAGLRLEHALRRQRRGDRNGLHGRVIYLM